MSESTSRMSERSMSEYLAVARARYRGRERGGRSRLLDEVCEVCAAFTLEDDNFVRVRLDRLHSTIDYIAPHDRLAGRRQTIFAARDKKLECPRENRKLKRRQQRACVAEPTTPIRSFPLNQYI